MAKPVSPEAMEKRQRALNLRKAGATYEQVAQQIGYANRGTAYTAVQEALREAERETQVDAHHLDEQRLDAMLMALWPKALQGSGWAVDRILEIMKLRREPEPVERLGKVAAGVVRDLEQLPDDLRESGLAATALELARNVDNGVSPATCARELRAALVQLNEMAKAAAVDTTPKTGGLGDLSARIAARRRQAAG